LLPMPTMSVGVGRIFKSVCFCLFVRSITQKRMIPKSSNLEYPRSDMDLGLKGQGHRVNWCIFYTNSLSITKKRMIPTCSNLMALGYPTSDMVLGWKVKVRVRVNSNTAWVQTLWVPSSSISFQCHAFIFWEPEPSFNISPLQLTSPKFWYTVIDALNVYHFFV